MKKRDTSPEIPTLEQLESERKRLRYRSRYGRALRSTLYALLVVAAAAVLVATIWMPVLQIYGGSMSPTLNERDIVVSIKGTELKQGDLVAFYVGNKILVKRVIAGPGETVDIDAEGNVYVDGRLLREPYLTEKSFGDANIELPYQVPENRYFCMGDHPLRWIPGIRKLAAFLRNRSSEKSSSGSGLSKALVCWNRGVQR